MNEHKSQETQLSLDEAMRRLKAAKISRYDHGGARVYYEDEQGNRDLIMDIYGEGHYRDLILGLIGGGFPALPDDVGVLKRIIARHVLWHDEALRLLQEVNTGYEGEWPELRRFVESSSTRVVLAQKAPEAPRREYAFDRYRDGRLMAEGIVVHAANIDEAIQKAHELRPDNRDTLVLRITFPAPAACSLTLPPAHA